MTNLILHDTSLLREAALVGDTWIEANAETGLAVTDPATGSVIGYVPKLGPDHTNQAIEAAEKARHAWAARTAKDRATHATGI